jgi:hypothetical protein
MEKEKYIMQNWLLRLAGSPHPPYIIFIGWTRQEEEKFIVV